MSSFSEGVVVNGAEFTPLFHFLPSSSCSYATSDYIFPMVWRQGDAPKPMVISLGCSEGFKGLI